MEFKIEIFQVWKVMESCLPENHGQSTKWLPHVLTRVYQNLSGGRALRESAKGIATVGKCI